jgi:structural maintenance of chromosomes protein 6
MLWFVFFLVLTLFLIRSGGERSYTTMCLLVALGETLETPFRILDEFDVFLDTEARKLTIKALIVVAKRMKHRQFIFITPQDLSSIQPDDQLKILKLTAPQRHGNAGGLSQQVLDFEPEPKS